MKPFRIELSGYNNRICYTVHVPDGTSRGDVVAMLEADKPIKHYRPNDWTPQMAYRCGIRGWTYGCGIDGSPDIRL